MNREKTYYKKVGKKYIPISYYDLEGVPEGLWLVTKAEYSRSCVNILYGAQLHSVQNVGKFCDFYKAHKEKLTSLISKEYDNFINSKIDENKSFSISDLADCIISALSKVEDF